jgi:DNA-binding protein HU-beta
LKKPDLADLVQQHFEANRRQALDFVDIFFDTITNAVAAGDKVSIAGFGIWEKKNRPARIARNPMTGAPVKVPAKTVAKFRAAADFKAIVLGGKRAAKKAKKVTAKKTKSATKTKPVKKAKKASPAKKAKKAAPAKKAKSFLKRKKKR